MDHETDVFIIGGGPAGLAAAIAASRKGFSVTVADGAEPPIVAADFPEGWGFGIRRTLLHISLAIKVGQRDRRDEHKRWW
jgi:2-polyprenyl-6-methoxyphenol hydroxylase-like FAD-dependent oxidoreductase